MDKQPLHDITLRKRKSRANETSDQREVHRAYDRANKRAKRAVETVEQHEEQLKKTLNKCKIFSNICCIKKKFVPFNKYKNFFEHLLH